MSDPGTTTVVNVKHDEYDICIMRAGWHGSDGYFGNQFAIRPGVPRETVIKQHRYYFLQRVARDAEYRRRVLELRGLRLGCVCKPLACHGDILAEWLNSQ